MKFIVRQLCGIVAVCCLLYLTDQCMKPHPVDQTMFDELQCTDVRSDVIMRLAAITPLPIRSERECTYSICPFIYMLSCPILVFCLVDMLMRHEFRERTCLVLVMACAILMYWNILGNDMITIAKLQRHCNIPNTIAVNASTVTNAFYKLRMPINDFQIHCANGTDWETENQTKNLLITASTNSTILNNWKSKISISGYSVVACLALSLCLVDYSPP